MTHITLTHSTKREQGLRREEAVAYCVSGLPTKSISFTLDDVPDYPRYCQITLNAENNCLLKVPLLAPSINEVMYHVVSKTMLRKHSFRRDLALNLP